MLKSHFFLNTEILSSILSYGKHRPISHILNRLFSSRSPYVAVGILILIPNCTDPFIRNVSRSCAILWYIECKEKNNYQENGGLGSAVTRAWNLSTAPNELSVSTQPVLIWTDCIHARPCAQRRRAWTHTSP